jgi:anti-sigma regulatory factor (Ser/Thr protein kinase)
VASFLDPAVRAGDPVLVVVDTAKAEHLRAELGPASDGFTFCDVRSIGGNPAHLIPTWRRFVDANAGDRALWGVSEPLWPERSPCEVAECLQHEVLINTALADAASLTLLCPFDESALPAAAVTEAVDRHPAVRTAGTARANATYLDVDPATLLSEPLPAAPDDAAVFPFTDGDLLELRAYVAAVAGGLGFGRDRSGDIVLAVDEVATNSYRHGGGGGTLRTWAEDGGGLVCEIRDRGRLSDPMVGRRRPPVDQIGGRGLWIANQLCDLVQVRSAGAGAVVRLYLRPQP